MCEYSDGSIAILRDPQMPQVREHTYQEIPCIG